jgi:hypothetical protein
MKIIAVSEGRKLAASENDRIRQNSRTSGSGAVGAKQPASLVIPKPARSAKNLLAASGKQQIPRATKPRFGMTILWGFSNYIITPRRAHYDPG